MALRTMKTQIRLPWTTGLPEDVTVNTLWAGCEDTDLEGSVEAWHAAIVLPLNGRIAQYLSTLIDEPNCQLRTYDMTDPEPREPFYVEDFMLTGVPETNDVMPPEVAICMSFQSQSVSGVPQARRRGRVFFGPLNNAAVSDTTGRPSTGLVTAVKNFGQDLLTASASDVTYEWAVFSPTTNQRSSVDNGWCDDEFDTMRSRGRRPTRRETFAI